MSDYIVFWPSVKRNGFVKERFKSTVTRNNGQLYFENRMIALQSSPEFVQGNGSYSYVRVNSFERADSTLRLYIISNVKKVEGKRV